MKLKNILLEHHLHSGTLLLESICEGLTIEQSRIVKGVYNDFIPLIEASLTQDQIIQVFTGVEQQATAGGSNRTLVGKAVDIPGKVNDIINKAGQWLQDTTPVKMADQKFEDLKAKVAAKFPELDKQLTGLGTWMKENPGKSAFVIGVLTALASVAGGPAGGAIAGQVLRGAAELIKGEKLSTAVGKGIKTAVFGYLTGKAIESLNTIAQSFRIKSIPFGMKDTGLERISFGAQASGPESFANIQGANIVVEKEMASAIRWAQNMLRSENPADRLEGFRHLRQVGEVIMSRDYRLQLRAITKAAWEATKENDSLLQWIKNVGTGLQAMGQGAVAASTGSKPAPKTESLSKSKINKIFYDVDRRSLVMHEGIFDKIKQFGKNITTKITADKLQSAWQAAGAPTDSDAVAKVLKTAGVADDIISKVFGDMSIPYTPSAAPETPKEPESKPTAKTVNTQDIVARIRKLTPAQQKEILALLGK